VSLVWGDHAPRSAVPSLQAYVSNLRRALRDPVTGAVPLQRRAPGYVLDTVGSEVDAETFIRHAAEARDEVAAGRWDRAAEVAGEAAALWRGPLLCR
jgi:DNA-binding SARP family transcriptional activator